MTILNIHAGSLPSFALRLKPATDSLTTLRERSAAKVRLQLTDGIPLALKYGWKGQRYSLEDDDDWEIFLERVGDEREADGESVPGKPFAFECMLILSPPSSPLVYLSSPEIPEKEDSDHHEGAQQANLPLIDESTLVARTPGRGKGG